MIFPFPRFLLWIRISAIIIPILIYINTLLTFSFFIDMSVSYDKPVLSNVDTFLVQETIRCPGLVRTHVRPAILESQVQPCCSTIYQLYCHYRLLRAPTPCDIPRRFLCSLGLSSEQPEPSPMACRLVSVSLLSTL